MNKTILNKQPSSFFETTFIFLFWLLLFILPLFYQWINSNFIRWNVIFNIWIDYLPLLIIFCVNRFVLTPFLLFKNKKFLYLLSVTIVIGLTVMGSIFIRKEFRSQNTNPQQKQTRLQFPNSKKAIKPLRNLERQTGAETYPPYVNLILLSILLVGFDTGMRTSVKWAETQKQKAEVEKVNVKNELAFLRNQVSPHFLMNTLNNIHALVDIDTREAKRSIGKLSVLMRHLLYESSDKPIPLTKEIQFVESYVELMKLRFLDEVEIKLNLPKAPPDIFIPTLLFTNILENAFKYGISYEQKSFVHINLYIHKNELEFTIQNSVHKKLRSVENTGIGIENTEKRLSLLYHDNYVFTHTEHENVYIATIKTPI